MNATGWSQFEAHVIENLRAARQALASASGLAQADNMVVWAGRMRELAADVHKLSKEIEENARRALQESCR